MRIVEFRYRHELIQGYFHGWGLTSIQLDDDQNEGVVTCAIIEGPDGLMYCMLPEMIRFVHPINTMPKHMEN